MEVGFAALTFLAHDPIESNHGLFMNFSDGVPGPETETGFHRRLLGFRSISVSASGRAATGGTTGSTLMVLFAALIGRFSSP